MTYFHCRTRIQLTRRQITILCRIFPLVQIQTCDPLIEMYVERDRNLSLKSLYSTRLAKGSESESKSLETCAA